MNIGGVYTYVRSLSTALITALTVLYTYYPHDAWITTAIAVCSTVVIHTVPSIQQSSTTPSRELPTRDSSSQQ